jgi:hypothetical protein
MNTNTQRNLAAALLILALSLIILPGKAAAAGGRVPRQGEPTPTETASPTLPAPSETPTPTETTSPPTATLPPAGSRPLVVIKNYTFTPATVTPGGGFTLDLRLSNNGQVRATNLIVTFATGDFLPQETGGVQAISQLTPGDTHKFTQPFIASTSLIGYTVGTLAVTVSYGDDTGAAFTETFNIIVQLVPPSGGAVAASPTPTPTATATPLSRPQLVVVGYSTDPAQLIPGGQFTLALTVSNLGNADAHRITMVAGGGVSAPTGEGEGGNPPGGIPGGSGEFTNFSPLGISNVQSLGDLAAGGTIQASQPLIVNVTTNPGAYSFKMSFLYTDAAGKTVLDDQVITLLVYSPPLVEVSFYQPPPPLFAGQPGGLPLQIVNLGRKTAVLGTMTVTAGDAYLENNSILIGTLESGGYFTLDPLIIPNLPGPLELNIQINYTDDFNQQQVILQTIIVDVLEAPPFEPVDPGVDGGVIEPEPEPETFWQKVWRFVLGLLGLDSAPKTPDTYQGEPLPFEETLPQQEYPVPAAGGKG